MSGIAVQGEAVGRGVQSGGVREGRRDEGGRDNWKETLQTLTQIRTCTLHGMNKARRRHFRILGCNDIIHAANSRNHFFAAISIFAANFSKSDEDLHAVDAAAITSASSGIIIIIALADFDWAEIMQNVQMKLTLAVTWNDFNSQIPGTFLSLDAKKDTSEQGKPERERDRSTMKKRKKNEEKRQKNRDHKQPWMMAIVLGASLCILLPSPSPWPSPWPSSSPSSSPPTSPPTSPWRQPPTGSNMRATIGVVRTLMHTL